MLINDLGQGTLARNPPILFEYLACSSRGVFIFMLEVGIRGEVDSINHCMQIIFTSRNKIY